MLEGATTANDGDEQANSWPRDGDLPFLGTIVC